eukprot:1037123-Prorocentrum_minimum.AAC.2
MLGRVPVLCADARSNPSPTRHQPVINQSTSTDHMGRKTARSWTCCARNQRSRLDLLPVAVLVRGVHREQVRDFTSASVVAPGRREEGVRRKKRKKRKRAWGVHVPCMFPECSLNEHAHHEAWVPGLPAGLVFSRLGTAAALRETDVLFLPLAGGLGLREGGRRQEARAAAHPGLLGFSVLVGLGFSGFRRMTPPHIELI